MHSTNFEQLLSRHSQISCYFIVLHIKTALFTDSRILFYFFAMRMRIIRLMGYIPHIRGCWYFIVLNTHLHQSPLTVLR